MAHLNRKDAVKCTCKSDMMIQNPVATIRQNYSLANFRLGASLVWKDIKLILHLRRMSFSEIKHTEANYRLFVFVSEIDQTLQQSDPGSAQVPCGVPINIQEAGTCVTSHFGALSINSLF
jgi:hypothetical protein